MFQRVLVIGNIKKAWKLGRICICKNMYMFLEDMYRTCLYSGVEVGVVRDKEAGDKASYWWESWECGGRFCTKSTLHRSMQNGLEVVKLMMLTDYCIVWRKRNKRFLSLSLSDWIAGSTIIQDKKYNMGKFGGRQLMLS